MVENITNWAQQSRLGFSAALLLIHANILTPLTAISIWLGTGSDLQIGLTVSFFFAFLVTVLSLQPIRIILGVFSLSLLIHLVVAIYQLGSFLL